MLQPAINSGLLPCLPCGIPALRDQPEGGFHRVNPAPGAVYLAPYSGIIKEGRVGL